MVLGMAETAPLPGPARAPETRTAAGNRLDFSASLETFQGPLDLLLYLIKENEVEITAVPIARILEQYLRFLDQAAQIPTGQVFHGQENLLLRLAQVEYLDNARVFQRRGGLGFLDEALAGGFIRGEGGRQQLERHFGMQRFVRGPVDRGEPAFAEFFMQFVFAEAGHTLISSLCSSTGNLPIRNTMHFYSNIPESILQLFQYPVDCF